MRLTNLEKSGVSKTLKKFILHNDGFKIVVINFLVIFMYVWKIICEHFSMR